jgi:CBS domain-containing protein
MGEQDVNSLTASNKAEFLRRLLDDIHALERMIDEGKIESGVTRIGAEQELCLVRESLRPAMTGPQILKALNHPNYTHELAQWNLEINLDPQAVGPGCLQKVEDQLTGLLALGQAEARKNNSDLLLTGILPTIRKSELDFKYMTPSPRFSAFNNVLRELRGEDFLLYIEGVDEVYLKHSSILFEACNTSFQIHLQVDPQEFADRYNWAQVIAGPLLAACVNSPLLLGKELWAETRIALFRQSIEIRHASNYMRDRQPRVAFGHNWLKSSAAEIFKNDISVYLLIIAAAFGEEPFSTDLLSQGEIPRLRAMNLHNGTLYKWNRACYGVGNGKPHLRIENRYIPSGPTPLDEMANLAFWIGLMSAMPDDCRGCWDKHFYFQEVRSNFLKAAQHGLNSEIKWFGTWYGASKLVLERLLPLAAEGLERLGIPHDESAKYLMIIESRAANRQTGSNWIVKSLRALRQKHTLEESLLLISRQMKENGLSDQPVHTWKLADAGKLHFIPDRYARVDSIMITNLVTVREDDLIEFASKLLEWNGFRHLPVENNKGEITGIISIKDIERYNKESDQENVTIASYMTSDVLFVAPETSLDKAERMMVANDVGSLPVVRDNRIIGIITARDIVEAKEKLNTVSI